MSEWITLEECETIYQTTLRAHADAYMEFQDAKHLYWGGDSPHSSQVLRERWQKFSEKVIELDRAKALLEARWAEERVTQAQVEELRSRAKDDAASSPGRTVDEQMKEEGSTG